MRLLHIDSSILGSNSVSRALSAKIVEQQRDHTPDLQITYRDLAAVPLQHLSGAHLAAAQVGAVAPDAVLEKDLEQGQAALAEFLAADIVVVGLPMYNFGVPSQLKAWIDRLAVAGKTFKYGPTGPVGLAGGKKVIIAVSRGGMYGVGTPHVAWEHQESHLKAVFEFFGITDITFIRAEGVAMADHRAKSIAAAEEAIVALT